MPGEGAKNSWILSFTFSMLLMSQMVLHTRASGTDFTHVRPQGPETNTPPPHTRRHVYECLFAGRGTCGCLASGCSMDSHGQSRDVHPLGEEC